MTVSVKQSGERKNSFAALLFSFGVFVFVLFPYVFICFVSRVFPYAYPNAKINISCNVSVHWGSMYFSTESIGDKTHRPTMFRLFSLCKIG